VAQLFSLGGSRHTTHNTTQKMKLKTITMIAAIAQLLALVFSFMQWFSILFQSQGIPVSRVGTLMFDIGQTVYLFAHVMLTIFLFVLAIKQSKN
jgi:hypothetical protein